MTEQDVLTRLREYHSYLDAQYNIWEDIRTGKRESMLGPASANDRSDVYRIAERKLEELFPELLEESQRGKIEQ